MHAVKFCDAALVCYLQKEHYGSGRNIGYRVVHQRLTQKYSFVVGRYLTVNNNSKINYVHKHLIEIQS